MSALAKYCLSEGLYCAGYDLTPGEVTESLQRMGMPIVFDDGVENIALPILEESKIAETLIVYTPAVPQSHRALNHFRERNYRVMKRAELLAALTNDKFCIAVAGTHGKTSTSTTISFLLTALGIPHYAFLGGISTNTGSNFVQPEAGREARVVVVEADEYDRSFLKLSPDIAVVTAIEADHLDIYGTEQELRNAFTEFMGRLAPDGTLLINEKYATDDDADCSACRVWKYGFDKNSDAYADNISVSAGRFKFDMHICGDHTARNVSQPVPGRHNVENAVAAIAAVYAIPEHITQLNFSVQEIADTLADYKGVKRRFEITKTRGGQILIDDYAHHPTELTVTINTARELYPEGRLLVFFQPHLYSRTRDLAQEFAQSLSAADEVVLLPLYPARELPIEGISSETIAQKIAGPPVSVLPADEAVNYAAAATADVIIVAGAGNIDKIVRPIAAALNKKETAHE